MKEFFEKVFFFFFLNQQTTKKYEKLPSRQRGNVPPIICSRQNYGGNNFEVSKSSIFHVNIIL